MKGYVYLGEGRTELRELPIPRPGHGEALVRMRLASICATDLKIIDGRFPVEAPRVIGHEFVGELVELGPGVEDYEIGARVLVHVDTPCGTCFECLANPQGRGCHRHGSLAAFHLGVLRDGAHAEYVVVPFAQANLGVIPDGVSDEQAVMLADVGSTGFAGVESSNLRLGDVIVIVGQGPIGLAATAAARVRGAALIVGVDVVPWRLEMSLAMGADVTVDASSQDVIEEVRRLTGGWMADVAVEAVGTPETFETALRLTRPAGVLSSIGNYGISDRSLSLPLDMGAFMGGVGDKSIVSTACPGGKDRSRRLLGLVERGRFDLSPLITHRFSLDEIDEAYEVFRSRRERVFKVAVRP